MLPCMDPLTRHAIEAIERIEREVAAMPPIELSPEYLADIERVMALPENQSGADKGWVWPAYEFLRSHFRTVRLVE
jgi:hypothetical protein